MTNKIWIILVTLTIFAFSIAYLKLVNSALVGLLLFTTFIKGQLVIDYFMGLKNVALKYRLLVTLWLGFVILLISVAYYSALPLNS